MKKVKPIKLKFFETFLYGLIYWVGSCAAIFMAFLGLFAGANAKDFFTIAAVPAVIALIFKILQEGRRKSLSKKVNVIIDENLPYSSNEIKHYLGLKEDEEELSETYYAMCIAYDRMAKSKLSYLITDNEASGKRDGSVYITYTDVKLKRKVSSILFYNQKVPTLMNASGHMFYLYPHFLLYVAGRRKTIAMPYMELGLRYREGSYALPEDKKTPRDANIIGYSYKYANKDGSPDKRVADNPSTPKISTGKLKSDEYDIEYMFSNQGAVEEFWEKYVEFIKASHHAATTKEIAKELTKEITTGIANKTLTEENAEEIAETIIAKGKEEVSSITNSKQSYDPYGELDSLIGLENVKEEVKTLANLVRVQQVRKEEGLKNSALSYHLVFTGNPGTGKTTIARIIASIYKDLKILKKGHLVETDRSGLVAEYLGQTAVKTNAVIDKALDGVLFIDEAYTLTDDQDSYGKEAVATLLKRMEDDRDRLVVILAGYTNNMARFITTNPGLESRFNRYIDFPDYSSDELYKIFMTLIKKYEYIIDAEAEIYIQELIQSEVTAKGEQFGNARFIRNLFEKVLANQANRLAKEQNLSADCLRTFTKEDCQIS